MLENVRLIVIDHWDFTDKESGRQIKGSKVVLTINGDDKLELKTSNEDVFECECLKTYYCDLYINEHLKIDIYNVKRDDE